MLALALLLAGCGSDFPPEPTGPEPWENAVRYAVGSREVLDRELEEILRASLELTREVTTTIGEGNRAKEVPARKPHDAQVLPTTWSVTPPPLFPRPEYVPGRRLFTLPDPPIAFAVANGGVVFFSDGEALYRRSEGRQSTRILNGDVSHLQFNEDGSVLLAKVGEDILFLEGDDWGTIRTHPHEIPQGRVSWSTEPGQLLVVSDLVQFAATEERRIFLDLYIHDLETGATRGARWADSHRLAAVGTLPPLAMTWGHLWRGYQINPIPAPLFLIEEGHLGGMITGMDGVADISPSANRDGHLFWIRTPRHGAHVGRAWWRGPGEGAEGKELQLTGRPTTHISTAPAGDHVAFVLEGGEGFWEVRMTTINELEAHRPALERLRTVHRGVEEKIRDLSRGLERDLLALDIGDSLRPSEFGTFLLDIPSPGEVDQMGEALRKRLVDNLGVNLGSGQGAASRLDMVLREAMGRLPEHPAIIMGVSSVLVDALPAGSQWYLDNATTGSLSVDVRDTLHSDDLTYQALLPFGVAREAIAGRLSLEQTTREVLGKGNLPIYLVENFRTDTLLNLRLYQLREDGFDAEKDNLGDLMDLLRDSDTPALAQMAVEQGLWMRREALALLGGLRLARGAPTNPEALFQLGEALSLLYLLEEALPFFQLAVELDPRRVDYRVALADCHLTLDEIDEAREQYTLANLADDAGIYREIIGARLETLRLIEEEAVANP